jgi:hypothetical protein
MIRISDLGLNIYSSFGRLTYKKRSWISLPGGWSEVFGVYSMWTSYISALLGLQGYLDDVGYEGC